MKLPAHPTLLTGVALALLAIATPAAGQRDIELPDIGSSANSIITPEQERMIGADMYQSLRRDSMVLDDPQLSDWLDTVGFRLAAHSDRPDLDYRFFLVRSPQINAFAAPGGFVGMNAGLVTTAETEDEVAAVMAHEIAHVTQRHIVRAVEKMQTVSLPILLGTLGALIAAQSAGSGEAAEAAIVSGTALMQQQAINFTRHNEYEADRVGIQTLARAGYEPAAMATFFWRLQRASRSDGQGVPEFLRTHPVTTTRISEAKGRAERVTRHKQPESDNGGRFLLMRERARVLGGGVPAQLAVYYRQAIESSTGEVPVFLRYGLGLALARSGRADEAVPVLAALVDAEPDSITLALALAEAEALAGQTSAARERLEALERKHRGHRAIAVAYGELLVAYGQREAARTAVEVLRPVVASAPNDALLQRTFARASELAGDVVRAGEAHADIAVIDGRFEDALAQLASLLKRSDVDYYERARIEARMTELTPIALEQRRRNSAMPPPPTADAVTAAQ
jgi:predicted Zn-dependent protease